MGVNLPLWGVKGCSHTVLLKFAICAGFFLHLFPKPICNSVNSELPRSHRQSFFNVCHNRFYSSNALPSPALSLTSSSRIPSPKPKNKDRCCTTPAVQQSQTVPEDKKAFRNQAPPWCSFGSKFSMGELWPIIRASLLFRYFTEEQRWGKYYTSDRDGAQPTTLNTNPGCVHYSTKHCTRPPLTGLLSALKNLTRHFLLLSASPAIIL